MLWLTPRFRSSLLLSPAIGLAALGALPLLVGGCANPQATAYIEIVNDQSEFGDYAEPVIVDPRCAPSENVYRRSYLNSGSNLQQRIVVKGPIMIVPAPTPTTRRTGPAEFEE